MFNCLSLYSSIFAYVSSIYHSIYLSIYLCRYLTYLFLRFTKPRQLPRCDSTSSATPREPSTGQSFHSEDDVNWSIRPLAHFFKTVISTLIDKTVPLKYIYFFLFQKRIYIYVKWGQGYDLKRLPILMQSTQ